MATASLAFVGPIPETSFRLASRPASKDVNALPCGPLEAEQEAVLVGQEGIPEPALTPTNDTCCDENGCAHETDIEEQDPTCRHIEQEARKFNKTTNMENVTKQSEKTQSKSLATACSTQVSMTSVQTFVTAHSSFASYVTASVGPRYKRIVPKELPSRQKVSIKKTPVSHTLEEFETVRSQWMDYLWNRGLLQAPMIALDWSGRGQHVEYTPEEAESIPLASKEILGHGAFGIVDRVRCRRVDLARKTIRCTRRLTKEEAVTEVEHLQRLQHRHVIRLVGTYTLKRDLAILVYPAAEHSLGEFLEIVSDLPADPDVSPRALRNKWTRTLIGIIACLTNAVAYIHKKRVKHMDIKPSNILVSHSKDTGLARVYTADFGIARSYKSLEASYTDSLVPFTIEYAAPEVARQDTRGPPADTFSLGCVFMETLATLVSKPGCDERERLWQVRSKGVDRSYHANVDAVLQWYETVGVPLAARHSIRPENVGENDTKWTPSTQWTSYFPMTLAREPEERSSAEEVKSRVLYLSCGSCDEGPEPFVPAEAH